jgi:hypothetical protein
MHKLSRHKNITDCWVDTLRGERYNRHEEEGIVKYTRKISLDIAMIISISEEESWFSVESKYSDPNILDCFVKLDWRELVYVLNDLLPIGNFLLYVLETQSQNPKIEIAYRTHQRFTSNEDSFNIQRTISLHLKNHKNYFQFFFDAILKNFDMDQRELLDIFKDIIQSDF